MCRALPSPLQVLKQQEVISKQLEEVGEDMERMQQLLDELDKLNNAVIDLDIRCGGALARWVRVLWVQRDAAGNTCCSCCAYACGGC